MARVALVNLSSLPMPGNRAIYPVGVVVLAAGLRRLGHHVRVLDFVRSPELERDFSWLEAGFDLIGVSVRNMDAVDLTSGSFLPGYRLWCLALEEACAHLARPPWRIGGGPGYSLFAPALVDDLHLHGGVIGPGVMAIHRLLAAGAPPQPVMAGEEDPDFGASTVDHEASLVRAYLAHSDESLGVESSRKTCTQGCVYCPYAAIDGAGPVGRSAIAVIGQELRQLAGLGARQVFFTDAVFNNSKAHAREIAAALERLDLPLRWSAYAIPAGVDEVLASSWIRAGVARVIVSPDSFAPAMMRRQGKHFTLAQVAHFLEVARKTRLPFVMSLLLGGPGEDTATVRETAAFANQHLDQGELIVYAGLRVLPGTPLAASMGARPRDLLEPAFLPIDTEVFDAALQSFDARFLPFERRLQLLLWRSSITQMSRVVVPGGALLSRRSADA